jgi:hypothetical protein
MQFAFILNEFGQKMNKWLNRVFRFGLNMYIIILGFAGNGQFTNKKGNKENQVKAF